MFNKLSFAAIVTLSAIVVWLYVRVNRLETTLFDLKDRYETSSVVIKPATPEPGTFNSAPGNPMDVLPPDDSKNQNFTTASFNKTTHNFGRIKQGAKASTEFIFTNTGSQPLTIQSARGSCGCTVPTWPHEPIAPGATGKITVVFDSYGKSGEQTKTVTVIANTRPSTTTLTIQSTVIPPEN